MRRCFKIPIPLPPFDEKGEILPGYASGIKDIAPNLALGASNMSGTFVVAGARFGFPALVKKQHIWNKAPKYVASARFGFVVLREGFFTGGSLPESLNFGKIHRLAILIHEARHGDGHGKHLGFIHSFCPDGHLYSGKPACDRSQNGPYSIESDFMRLFFEACKQDPTSNGGCREDEMAAIQGVMLSTQYRVLDPSEYPVDSMGLKVGEHLDPTPTTLVIRDRRDQ